jgi:predicted metal-binding membrane protein
MIIAEQRRLATAVWTIAGACWAATVAAALLGLASHGEHDAVLAGSALPWWGRLAAFTAVWTVMVGAMMLPSTVPMLEVFWAASTRQPRPRLVRAAMVAPYFAGWLGFAGLALAGDAVVHRVVEASDWLAARPGLVLGGVLILAGAFQFSDLKKACLTACRSPLSMLWEHYGHGVRAAWRVGWRHVLNCLGCCWALMLVMFATGTGSLLWMLLLTGVMVAEKTTSWGARLVAPAGIALIAGGLAVSLASVLAHTPAGHVH